MSWQPRGAMMVVGGVLVGVCFCMGAVLAKESTTKSRTSTSSSATDPDIAKLSSKLDEVLANQQLILQKFDAVMEELRIIKVRATIHGS